MNVFKRKSIHAAVLASLGAMGVAGSAEAVQLGQDGTGSVLIYPYYTVRTAGNGAYNTYVNVINTTNSAKVVKVRFLEGKNSREVLDFNLWLSPRDVWAGMIAATATGATLTSPDESCVSTKGGVNRSISGGVSFDFTNAGYTGGTADPNNLQYVDGADTSLDRTREGYIEIIEMGDVTNAALVTAITHNSSGRPANCSLVPTTETGAAGTAGARVIRGSGGLKGGAHLINVNNGSDFGYDPVVFEDFSTNPQWYPPGTIEPTLMKADPLSTMFYYHKSSNSAAFVTDVVTDTHAAAGVLGGVNAVSAVIDRTAAMNAYVLDTGTTSKTDWVVTFPTKRHYVVPAAAAAAINKGPFTNWSEFNSLGSCGVFSVQPWDREEQTPGTTTTEVSPPTPGAPADQICWEANVLTFHQGTLTDSKKLLGSTNARGVVIPVGTNYEHGWARLAFPLSIAAADGGYTPIAVAGGNTYNGLPMVGFMLQDFINPNVTINGVPSASSYGGNFTHGYERLITGVDVTNP